MNAKKISVREVPGGIDFKVMSTGKHRMSPGDNVSIQFTVNGIVGESMDDIFTVRTGSYPRLKISKGRTKNFARSLQNSLRGLERRLAWILNGEDPDENDLDNIHEGLLELYAPRTTCPIEGTTIPVRSSKMSRAELVEFINRVLMFIATQDIPNEVRDAATEGLYEFYQEFYEWKENEAPRRNISWKQYKEECPVCEFSFSLGSPMDPLEQMHIVTRGSSPQSIDEPWNWIRGLSSIHRLQHQVGWNEILKRYPHVAGKVHNARRLAQKREL